VRGSPTLPYVIHRRAEGVIALSRYNVSPHPFPLRSGTHFYALCKKRAQRPSRPFLSRAFPPEWFSDRFDPLFPITRPVQRNVRRVKNRATYRADPWIEPRGINRRCTSRRLRHGINFARADCSDLQRYDDTSLRIPLILYRRNLIIEMRAITFDTFHSCRAYSALARCAPPYLPLCNSLLLSHGKAPGALITVAVSVATLHIDRIIDRTKLRRRYPSARRSLFLLYRAVKRNFSRDRWMRSMQRKEPSTMMTV